LFYNRQVKEEKKMKIYALKYKDEFVDFSDKQFDMKSSYRWEREEVKGDLTIVSGEFVEDK